MERDCESKLSKLNIEQNACIYHFGASVIHGQRSNILRLRVIKYIYYKIRDYFGNICTEYYLFYPSKKLETNIDRNHWRISAMGNHNRYRRSFMVLSKVLVWGRYLISLKK